MSVQKNALVLPGFSRDILCLVNIISNAMTSQISFNLHVLKMNTSKTRQVIKKMNASYCLFSKNDI